MPCRSLASMRHSFQDKVEEDEPALTLQQC